jgi:L-amino acid N-acyltransferase YncA
VRLTPLEDGLKEQCLVIFNQIIAEGVAFPWEQPFTLADFDALYLPGEPVWCAVDDNGRVLGFVHIHPNSAGRCAHIANCGYSVRRDARSKGVGRALVLKSLEVARAEGFKGIQFNAVVADNAAAIALYQSLGFQIIGTVPNGFRQGTKTRPRFVDMHIMYRAL